MTKEKSTKSRNVDPASDRLRVGEPLTKFRGVLTGVPSLAMVQRGFEESQENE